MDGGSLFQQEGFSFGKHQSILVMVNRKILGSGQSERFVLCMCEEKADWIAIMTTIQRRLSTEDTELTLGCNN